MPPGMDEALFQDCFKTITYEKMIELSMLDFSAEKPLLPENLPDEIHPLFEFSTKRWEMPDAREFHNGFRTGLKLASFLLETDHVVSWFNKALHGEYRSGVDGGFEREYIVDIPNDEPYEVYQELTRDMLRDTILPYVCFSSDYEPTEDRVYASCVSHTNRMVDVPDEEEHMILRNRVKRGVSINFHPKFAVYARRRHVQYGDDSSPWFQSIALDMRCQLIFAFTLLHECAHVFEQLRFSVAEWDESQVVGFSRQNVFYNIFLGKHEWGFELENHIAGMIISGEVDLTGVEEGFDPMPKYGLLGITRAFWESYEYEDYGKYELLSMEWVNCWFRKENLAGLNFTTLANLPKPSEWYLRLEKQNLTNPALFSLVKRNDSNEEIENNGGFFLGSRNDFTQAMAQIRDTDNSSGNEHDTQND
jgi:hypothetical protein